MASNPATLASVVADALQLGSGAAGSLPQELDRLTGQLQTLGQAALDSAQANTQAVQASTTQASSSSGGGAGSVAKTVLDTLGAGLGLSPLISGVLSLFGGGGGNSAPPALTTFALPASQDVTAGVSGGVGGPFGVSDGQGGVPRPVTTPSPQITVNVSAMDTQGFLDRSNDIALAVRQAMLESSVLNDVVREA